jgi:pyridoxal phosphate enzyme (YggS family)
MDFIKQNLKEVEERIARACEKAGRNREEVTLIAVSKTKPVEMLETCIDNGITIFGENKVQEMCEKYEVLPKDLHWHMIGHLQRNKVKYITEKAELIHSVDSFELAEKINQEAKKVDIVQHVLLQVNNAGEQQKSGFAPSVLIDSFGEILELKNIKVDGLMNMAPLIDDKQELKRLFDEIAELKTTLECKYGYKMDELSMGMSGDYTVAVASGATMIRIGRKLFTDKV